MATAGAHYQNLLARHYTWMLGGDLEAAAARERQVLEDLGVRTGTVAVDLGCGPGPQTLALADMGFRTGIGVDTSQQLLDELAEHAHSIPSCGYRRTGAWTTAGSACPSLPDRGYCGVGGEVARERAAFLDSRPDPRHRRRTVHL